MYELLRLLIFNLPDMAAQSQHEATDPDRDMDSMHVRHVDSGPLRPLQVLESIPWMSRVMHGI